MNYNIKDRTPKETIEIIENFFIINNYTCKIIDNHQSESGTWSSLILLYKNNVLCLQGCGKGMTEEYSLASAYGELYERFCNLCEYIRNPIFCIEYIKQNQNYCFHPQEKNITYEEIMSYKALSSFYYRVLKEDNYIQDFFNLITDYKYIGEPFINLSNKTVIYQDPRILNRVCGSEGMSAGNTLEEALNQGISEICERIVRKQYFNNEQEKYYLLDLNYITDSSLKNKINNIQKKYQLYIFDLSYNFKLPVIMTVLFNPIDLNSHINFGAFPIAEVAIERTITEIYQGIIDFNFERQYQIPSSLNNPILLNEYKISLKDFCLFNENIFLNKKIIKVLKPSNIFYRDLNYSNKLLNQYYINLFDDLRLSIYYCDKSLLPTMKAIQIFVPEIDYEYGFANINNYLIESELNYLKNIKKCINQIYYQNNFDVNLFSEILNYTNSNLFNKNLNFSLTLGNWFAPISTCLNYTLPDILKNHNNKEKQLPQIADSIYYYHTKILNTITKYLEQGYSQENIIEIFNKFFNISLNDFHFSLLNNYWQKIEWQYIQSSILFFNSQDYKEIIKSLQHNYNWPIEKNKI